MSRVAKWKQLTEQEFAELVKESRSFQDLARKVGYEKTSGSAAISLKRAVTERNLDTSHFLGQGWNKNNYDFSSFDQNSVKKKGKSLSAPLIHLRGRKCECCGVTEWLGQPINLEAHHKNGDRSDNSLENLELLCPNCHSYKETFCRKSTYETVSEENFVLALQESSNIRQALKMLGLTPAGANYERARELIEKYKLTHLYSK